LAELAGLDDVVHPADRARIYERVIDEQHQVALARLLYELAALLDRLRHRLLEPQMLAGLQSRHPELEMGADRRRDGDRVDRGIVEQLLESGGHLRGRVAPLYELELLRIE